MAYLFTLSALLLTQAESPFRFRHSPKGSEVALTLPPEIQRLFPLGLVDPDLGEEWLRLRLVEGDKAGPPLFGTFRHTAGTLTFRPRLPLETGRRYRAEFGPEGKPTAMLDYRVPPPESAEAPRVLGIHPSGKVLPANHLRFYIRFSRPMRGGPETFKNIRLLDAQGKEIRDPWLTDELWAENDTLLILYIHPGRIKWGVLLREILGPVLEPDRDYTLVIGSRMLDAVGRPLGKDHRIPIRIGPENRTRLEPIRWKLETAQAGTTGFLTVRFDRNLDRLGLDRHLQVVDDAGRTVPGTTTIGPEETTWKFRPTRSWKTGSYSLRIAPDLEDSAGNTPVRPFDLDLGAPEFPPPTLTLPFEVR